jgi:hypothetical protein
MKVWLDDDPRRDPPAALGWTIARNADEAIALLAAGGVEAVSLDHDLEDIRYEPYPREVTGMDVVRWMVANRVFPKVMNIHSANPDRSRNMASDLFRAAPLGTRVAMWRFDGPGLMEALEEWVSE